MFFFLLSSFGSIHCWSAQAREVIEKDFSFLCNHLSRLLDFAFLFRFTAALQRRYYEMIAALAKKIWFVFRKLVTGQIYPIKSEYGNRSFAVSGMVCGQDHKVPSGSQLQLIANQYWFSPLTSRKEFEYFHWWWWCGRMNLTRKEKKRKTFDCIGGTQYILLHLYNCQCSSNGKESFWNCFNCSPLEGGREEKWEFNLVNFPLYFVSFLRGFPYTPKN